MPRSAPSFIVGIGGSAGGLNAYRALLDALPPNTGMAFVIICHMDPEYNSQLAELLARRTKMPVRVASQAMPIEKDHVYIIPRNADLFIEKNAFKVVSPRVKRNNQVDLFLTSLATEMGARAIAIILTGYDGDGAKGCKNIKANGGITFAQQDAEVPHMPLTAQATGAVDFLLPIDKIVERLRRLRTSESE